MSTKVNCILHDGPTFNGYGFDGNNWAHREAWKKVNGPIPRGGVIMHTCDNPLCVNPEHLKLGSQADNMRDAQAKGRLVKSAETREKIRQSNKGGPGWAGHTHSQESKDKIAEGIRRYWQNKLNPDV
jgi:hypothetical protein